MGVLQATGGLDGSMSYLLQDEHGQVQETHSISAGLDYPGVGPEHSWLKDAERAQYHPVNDAQALEGFHLLCRTEGIIPALESAHAIYYATQLAGRLSADQSILVCLSGRGIQLGKTTISPGSGSMRNRSSNMLPGISIILTPARGSRSSR